MDGSWRAPRARALRIPPLPGGACKGRGPVVSGRASGSGGGCGGGIRTRDLQVMSLTRYHFSTPRLPVFYHELGGERKKCPAANRRRAPSGRRLRLAGDPGGHPRRVWTAPGHSPRSPASGPTWAPNSPGSPEPPTSGPAPAPGSRGSPESAASDGDGVLWRRRTDDDGVRWRRRTDGDGAPGVTADRIRRRRRTSVWHPEPAPR